MNLFKTSKFLQWLGVAFCIKQLRYAEDALDASYEQAVATPST